LQAYFCVQILMHQQDAGCRTSLTGVNTDGRFMFFWY